MDDLFTGIYKESPDNTPIKTCRTCKHRERWQCGGSIIQYCGVVISNRTFNKKLKIKCNKPACEFYEEA
jgi:hypothetical protein